MSDNGTVQVDFQVVKQVVTIPDVLRELDLIDQFTVRDHSASGVCPIPTHSHNPVRPNPQQFKADDKKGTWLWKCFSPECGLGGDVIELVKQVTGLDNQHVRLWFWDRFQSRLSGHVSGKPKKRTKPKKSDTKKAGECGLGQKEGHSPTPNATEIVSDEPAVLKPLRWQYQLDVECPYLLEDRKLKPETIGRFEIGLCTRAKTYLTGYIAIPIFVPGQADNENPVSYVGRFAGEKEEWTEDVPRYKFWSEFPRNAVVYNLRDAVRDSSDDAPLVIVEGPFKCFWLYQKLGLTNAVATFGASLSDEQATLLAETGRPLALMWDGNARQAARLAAAKLIRQAFVRVVQVDDGVEPDQLKRKQLRQLLSFML